MKYKNRTGTVLDRRTTESTLLVLTTAINEDLARILQTLYL